MKKIFAELNAFRPELLCVLVSVAAGVGATLGLPPICQMRLVSVAAGVGATLGLPTHLSDIINRGIADKDMNYILHTGVIMLGIAILGMVCNITTGFCLQNRVGFRTECEEQDFYKGGIFLPGRDRHIFNRVFDYAHQQRHYPGTEFHGHVSARYSDSAYHVRGGHHAGLQQNPKMSSILVVSMPVMVLIISLIGRRAMPLSRKMQTRIDRINLIMREKLSGIRVIRAFGTEGLRRKSGLTAPTRT